MIAQPIRRYLYEFHNVNKISFQAVGGGSINEAYSFTVNDKKIFLKFNNRHPRIIEHEVEALKTIAKTGTVKTPHLIDFTTIADHEVLQLSFIDSGNTHSKPQAWELFGIQLAELHQYSNAYYGWPTNNYIGSMHQQNDFKSDYKTFLIENRYEPQISSAFDQDLLSISELKFFDKLFSKINDIIPESFPSLVHGDLWSGNFMISNQGVPYLIDPSIHYNNREFDLAFTHLFGGFNEAFYKAYDQTFPLEEGFQQRISFYNLYPLLVHLNLFGAGYHNSVMAAVKKYV